MVVYYHKIGLACMYCTVLFAWLQIFFLNPMSDEAIDMEYRQLDPEQIIVIPYSIHRLIIYVVAVVIVGLITIEDDDDDSNGFLYRIFTLLKLSIIVFCIFILCGTSPYVNLLHTLLSATYLVILSCGYLDPPIFASMSPIIVVSNNNNTPLIDQIIKRMHALPQRHFNSTITQQQQIVLGSIIFHCTVGITIPMQILLLYDRGWQIQRWPVPVILGSTIGWIVGTLLGTITIISGVLNRYFVHQKKEDDDG